MKKILVLALTLVLLMNTLLVSAGAAAPEAQAATGVTPRWTNCTSVNTSFGVANNVAEVFIDYNAKPPYFSHAVLEVTVQKRFLLAFWKDVGDWSVTSYDDYAFYFADIPVDGKGKYRANFHLEFYGTTGEVDIVEHTTKYDYKG